MRSLNVLIGANGAGKSNFVDFFRMLRAMSEVGLENFVKDGGGSDGYFFDGPKQTPEIKAHLTFGENEYRFVLGTNVENKILVKNEDTLWVKKPDEWSLNLLGRTESLLKYWKGQQSKWGPYLSVEGRVAAAISAWTVYHFHDTSRTARMRREQSVRDFRELAPDAGNIAAFLYRMKGGQCRLPSEPFWPPNMGDGAKHYRRILETVQLIAPFLDDFLLEPEMKGENEVIRLEWRQKSSSFPFQAWQLSDGTIRFICLATALLQPNPPATIVIDEPELGLHPFALELLASLVKEAATRTQIIISTQSPALLNSFEPEDVVVVDRVSGASRFLRLEEAGLKDWLDDFTLGELVQKNIIEAGPGEQRATIAN